MTFTIDPAARFSDGKPVMAEDVVFSWQLLRDKGRPNFRTYYAKVAKAEALSERVVRFDLTGADDRELPLILGLMPVLAKHAINPDTFEDTTLDPIVGSGPYVIDKVDAGRSVTLKRNPNYWGRDLAVNRGYLEFRRNPLRLLPRRPLTLRGLHQGPLRGPLGARPEPLGNGLRRAPRARWTHRQGDVPDRTCPRACRG